MRPFSKDSSQSGGPVLLCGLGLVALLSIYFFFRPGLLDTANNRLYDIILRSIPRAVPSSLPVIVDIDDESLRRFGQWPWPRYRIARLLEMTNTLGPRAVALDMTFPEADRTSLDNLQNQIEHDFGLHLQMSEIAPELKDNDAILAKTLSKGPFVLGYKFRFDAKPTDVSDCRLHPAPVIVIQSDNSPNHQVPLFTPSGITCNINPLCRAVTHSGFIDATTDDDGALRRMPLLMAYHDKIYPSLALAAFLQAFGPDQLLLRTNAQGVKSLTVMDRQVPLDERGHLLIRFRGPQHTFPHLSAAKIMAGKVLKSDIENRIVFIGTSAMGLRDFHTTPFDPLFPGVEAHATIIDNLVQGDFIWRARWMLGVELVLGLIVGILSAVLIAYGRAIWSILAFIISAVGLWVGASGLLKSHGVFISPFIPLCIFVVNFSFLTALKYWREERRGKKKAQELAMVQAVTLETIATVIEKRHTETGGHVKRTQHYVRQLAQYLQKNKKYRSLLDDETIELLFRSSPLHDVGKVGVPDSVLKNPGKLNGTEFEVMKNHTVYGKQIFDAAEAKLGHNSFLSIARTIAYTHHEKWDGTGYPQGLTGETIPLYGRIMAIADIYDALTSKRIYKEAMSHDDAVAYIREKSGQELDPVIVNAFLKIQNEFKQIANRFTDRAVKDVTFTTP